MEETKKTSFAEMLKKRDIRGLIELFRNNALDTSDELLLLKSYEIPIISHYATLYRLKDENLKAIINKETPEYVIENIIKINKYAFNDELQQKLIDLRNSFLIKCYLSAFNKFSDKVLIEAIRKKDNRFLKDYINQKHFSHEVQKELVHSRNVEMIILYCDRHGFYKEVQKEFVTYLDTEVTGSIH
jgi:hypothetical protein